jgi:hypothetical protein
MSCPGSVRPDLCSICTADEQNELAEATRGGFSVLRRAPGRDGCGIRVHTIPESFATSTVATCHGPARVPDRR